MRLQTSSLGGGGQTEEVIYTSQGRQITSLKLLIKNILTMLWSLLLSYPETFFFLFLDNAAVLRTSTRANRLDVVDHAWYGDTANLAYLTRATAFLKLRSYYEPGELRLAVPQYYGMAPTAYLNACQQGHQQMTPPKEIKMAQIHLNVASPLSQAGTNVRQSLVRFVGCREGRTTARSFQQDGDGVP